MRFLVFAWLFALILGQIVNELPNGDTTTSSISEKPTMVWVTVITNGMLATVQAPFTQSFMSPYPGDYPVASGLIGLGSLSGEVGKIREYGKTTVTDNGAVAIGPKVGGWKEVQVPTVAWVAFTGLVSILVM